MKIRSVAAQFSHADRRTDMTNFFRKFCKRA